MACWDVQDACVFWWESFFIFSSFFFFFPSKMCGNVLQASHPNREPFCWNFAEDNLFLFFLPETPNICIFSLLIFAVFFAPVSRLWYCKGRDRSSCGVLPPSACCIIWFICLTHKIMFLVCQVPVQSGLPPRLVCELILTRSPFGHSWRGTECKPEHTRSQECNCPSSGTKSISLPFGPCTFFLQRGQPWHWDPGLREQKTRDASCTVFSEEDFCSRCLVKALPLTTPLSKKHTTVSFWLTCSFCSCWLCDNEQTLVHGAEK